MSRSTSGSSGPFQLGTLNAGVRWKTVSCAACCAISGITWMPDDPVPSTPTRRPVKSTGSCGHSAVW